jgi:hypothetical protein
MKKTALFTITILISILHINAQSISVPMTKTTDTLFFKMDVLTEELSNTANFKLAVGNKFKFGQVTMKAHKINPFKLPKVFMNNKAMNVGINLPNLDQDAVFTFYNPADTGILNLKSPIGDNAAEISFVFSKKDLVEGDNEIKISVNEKDNQNDLAITDLKLYLRAPLNSDNVIVQIPAEFPGGQKGWINYLEKSVDTDLPVRKGAPVGKYSVVVSFIVDKEGIITDIKAENDPGYGTKEEAIRVIKNGPKWVPATQNGRNVIYRQRQAIVFLVSYTNY